MRKTLGIFNIVVGAIFLLMFIRGCAGPSLPPDFLNFSSLPIEADILGIALLGGGTSIAGLFLLEGNWRTLALTNLGFTGILVLTGISIMFLGR